MNQYHPNLQRQFQQQLKAYVPLVESFAGWGNVQSVSAQVKKIKDESDTKTKMNQPVVWDDPYKNIQFWPVVDFLRNSTLTR